MPASHARPAFPFPHPHVDLSWSAQQARNRRPAPGVPALMGCRQVETELAVTAIERARGGYVWTGETGSGKSTLLDSIVTEASESAPAHPFVITRLTATSFATDLAASPHGLEGTAIESFAAQLFPTLMVEDLGPSSPPSPTGAEENATARCCASVVSRLVRELSTAHPGVTCVVVVDDFDLIDAFSRDVLITLVAQRQVGVVLLASASEDFDGRNLPHPIALRQLAPASAVDALLLLGDERPDPTSPEVAASLARLLKGNAAAIIQTARELSHDQMRGASMLPDPLPPVPALHALHGGTLDALSAQERRLLLLAAVAVVDRTEVLLSAAGMRMSEVLERPVARDLHFVGGRFSFPDPRLRSLVHGTASLAERTAAHMAMARAHADAYEDDATTWHIALGSLAGDPSLAPDLLTMAQSLLAQGELERAHRVAREALSQGAPEIRAHAQAIAGTAALGAGFVIDAVDSLRQAMRWGDEALAAQVLPSYVEALTLYEGQVPDEAVSRQVSAVRSGEPSRAELTDVICAVASAARLHCERGEGSTARHLLATAHDLLAQLEALIPPAERVQDGQLTPHIGRARTEISCAEACAGLFGIDSDGGPFPAPRNFTAAPDVRGRIASHQALDLALMGHTDEAARVLTDALASVAHIDNVSGWSVETHAAASPLAEAHLAVAQALVDFWAGSLGRATETLIDAALRLPIALPFAGVASALMSRLSILGQPSATALASSLSESRIAPASRPVRFSLLVDRALSASFEGRRTEASALLELSGEQDAPSGTRFIPLPGLGEVETWLDANQPDAARRALTRLRSDVRQRSDASRRCALIRAEVALSDLSDDGAYGQALEMARTVRSPYERARIEMILGRTLLRVGNTGAAHAHLVTASELFDYAGAPAWCRVVKVELARLLEDVLEVTSSGSGTQSAAEPSSQGPEVGSSSSSAPLDSPLFAPTQPGENAAIAASLARWERILTRREFDVATLVAQGRSNREVAETLFLSIRTIEVHLGRVFRKLGVSSRLELAVIAHRK